MARDIKSACCGRLLKFNCSSVNAFGAFLEKLGQWISTLGYVLVNPSYAKVRRSGGARDLYRLLNKAWLQPQHIGTVLDVGANEGQFIKVARLLFPGASILAFEPNPRLMHCLQGLLPKSGMDAVFQIACGREAASMPLHLAKFSPATSLLPSSSFRIPDFPTVETEETIEVKVERLDCVVGRHGVAPKPYLLKIDVQGFELDVLHGALGILPDVAVVVCEVNAVSFYEGQAGFEDIYAFMQRYNFKLVDIGEPIRTRETGEVLYVDVAFLNTRCNAGASLNRAMESSLS
jgi:FkbM family methyltransferase